MLDFNVSPYYDDFYATNGAKDNNYMRILFKPGYAVQARELTQIQTILQNQIQSLGDNIFQNGSPVTGGHLTYDNNVISIQLQPTQNNTPISISDFNEKLIINANGLGLQKAVVVAIDDSLQSNTSAGALVVKYLTGAKFAFGDEVTTATGSGQQYQATILTSDSKATGTSTIASGSIVSINDGIFYVNGFFVSVAPQAIVLDSQNTAPSFRVGLEIQEHVVNYNQDSALLDPAQGSFNYQAPGADRYQFNLALAKRTLTSIDDSSFFELMRIENGVITSQVNYPLYSSIGDAIAKTVYDQSGDFIINPFLLSLKDNAADPTTNSFLMTLSAGSAYIRGYEFETLGSVTMTNDKARTSNTSLYYDLAMEYGDYFVVSNVYSGNAASLSIGNYTEMDLHVVPTASINTYTISAYSNSVIGSANVRNIEYAGGSDHYAYVLDVKLSPLVGYANDTVNGLNYKGTALTVANTNYISFSPSFPNDANVYIGKNINVISGNCSGDIKTIIDFDSANNIAEIGTYFSQLPDSTTNFFINFGIGDVRSLTYTPANSAGIITPNVSHKVYATQSLASGLYPCMDISINGKQPVASNGSTQLYLNNYNCLVYELPQQYIVQNSIGNVYFYSRKWLPGLTFDSAGNTIITSGATPGVSSTETFTFGYTNSYIPQITANSNILVVVRNNSGGSLYPNGSIISFDTQTGGIGNSVYQTSSSQITLHAASGGGNSFIGDVIVTMQEGPGASNTAARRTKTLFGPTSVITGHVSGVLLATDSPTNATAITGTVNNSVGIDASNGYVWFTNYNDIYTTPGVAQSLYVPDVRAIIAIYDSGSPSWAPSNANSSNLIDVTNSYQFNTGQTDNYYDHASITLKPGFPVPLGQILVMMEYYNHSTTAGFFTGGSYPLSDYQNGTIPYYNSVSKGTIALRDAIDFRPTRAIGTAAAVNTFTLQGLLTPQPDHPMILSYSYYLPRIDKLTLTKNKQFRVISGAPAVNPSVPSDSDDAMTLYVLNIPAYTDDVSKIQVQYIDHRRYTMQDIGKLDERITSLEQYVALSQLQQQTLNQIVTYTDGSTPKPIYGAITDSFSDFSIADTSTTDVICSIQNGALAAHHAETPLDLVFYGATGPYKINDKTFSLTYTESPAVVQNTATANTTVKPFGFGEFYGILNLTPQSDSYFSANITPIGVTPVGPRPPHRAPPAPVPPSPPLPPPPPTPKGLPPQPPVVPPQSYPPSPPTGNPPAPPVNIPVPAPGYGGLYGGITVPVDITVQGSGTGVAPPPPPPPSPPPAPPPIPPSSISAGSGAGTFGSGGKNYTV
jgi:hypothetical protein